MRNLSDAEMDDLEANKPRVFSAEQLAIIEQTKADLADEMCTCGDPSSQHIDGCEQCVIPECGCKEFEDGCQD